jgi:hypothetical protein
LGERLLCKQEVAGSIPAGSIAEVPAKRHLLSERHGLLRVRSAVMEALWKPGPGASFVSLIVRSGLPAPSGSGRREILRIA